MKSNLNSLGKQWEHEEAREQHDILWDGGGDVACRITTFVILAVFLPKVSVVLASR